MPALPTRRRDLVEAGMPVRRVEADLRAGRSLAPFRGVHVDAQAAAGALMRVRAAAATQSPTAAAALQTAAVLQRLRWLPPGWLEPAATVHFAVEPGTKKRNRDGLKLHRRLLTPDDLVVIDGICCLSVARNLVELARVPTLSELVVVQIIDGALRDQRVTRAELLACLERLPRGRGIVRARALVDRSRDGVDSPQETRMRLMLEDGGISGLDVDIKLFDTNGDLVCRGDLGIKRLLIWGEYDGYEPHSARETFRADRPRGRHIQRRGWFVMRFADVDLARPAALCAEWKVAMADAPARIAALNPRLSPEVAWARQELGFD